MKIEVGKQYALKVTTDEFLARVLRELGEDEKDPDVGPMYEISIHVYDDELNEMSEDEANPPSHREPSPLVRALIDAAYEQGLEDAVAMAKKLGAYSELVSTNAVVNAINSLMEANDE